MVIRIGSQTEFDEVAHPVSVLVQAGVGGVEGIEKGALQFIDVVDTVAVAVPRFGQRHTQQLVEAVRIGRQGV